MPALIVISLLSILACCLIARSRSADIRFWALMGLLLGPLAIPFALFSKPKAKD
jgi:hypothetical protein